jgi:radical SAM superfamily enzyme YgiQ (UPF0313 family)
MSKVAAGEYLAVGTGGFVYGINWFRETLGQLRSLSPETPLILGGNITRNVRLEILLNRLPLDFAVVGEAESSFPQLLRALADGTSFETIPGVAFKGADGNIVRNAPVRFALDQENVLPAYEEADLQYYIDIYRHHVAPGLGRAVPVLTGRGCKGGCSFCSPTVGRFKPRKIEHVLEEIEEWNRRYSFECFIFATEVFFTEDEDIVRFCREYKKIRPHKPWGCSYRMDQSLDLLGVMKDAGCVFITAGLESGSETILPQLKHGCTVDQFRQTLEAARRVGLVLDSPFMMANENETEKDLKQTIDFVIDNKMDANFGLVGTYPGTPIYHRAMKKGMVGDEWEFITNRLQEWAWRSPSATEADYFNISAMPTSRVFGHVYRQIRRYYTFQYNEFQARDVSLVSVPNGSGSQDVGLSGCCFKCGRRQALPIRQQDVISVIEYFFRCPACHQKNFLPFVSVPEARTYYEALGRQLREAERIVVLGVGKDASDFCFYDLFGLDLDRIVGFVDPRGAAPEKKFYHFPRYRLADLETVDYDLILVTDLDRNVAKLLLCTSTAAQSKPVCFLAPSKLGVPEPRPRRELVGVGT